MNPAAKLFGSLPRSRILVAIALLGTTYAGEIERALRVPHLTVQRVLRDFEREGIVVIQTVGRNRMVSLNERMAGAADLRAFLLQYARRTDVEQSVSLLRRRPRRTGKPLNYADR
jgi:DNA-binding transcriptional ArsR family regulator